MTTTKRAAARVIDAWDSTVLPVANDGRLQEAMEDLRAALAEQAAEPTTTQRVDAAKKLANEFARAVAFGTSEQRIAAGDRLVAALIAAPAAPAAEQAEPVAWPFRCGQRKLVRRGHAQGLLREIAAWMRRDGVGDCEAVELVSAYIDAIEAAPPAPARQEPLTVTRQLEAVGRVAEVHMSRYTVEWLDRPYPSGTVLYADIIEAAMNGPRRRREQHALPAAPITAAPPAPARQEPPADWSVFNTGAQVAGGLTYAEALDYLTPARLERGWTAVCVVNKDNITAAPAEGGAAALTQPEGGA